MSNKNKICVYNPQTNTQKYIDNSELSFYESKGFIKGGKPLTEEHKNNIGKSNKGKSSKFKGVKRDKEVCNKISKSKMGKKHSSERKEINRKCHKGFKWYNNGEREIYTKSSPKGWARGRLPMSEEQKCKLSDSHKGKTLTPHQLEIRATKEYLTKKKNNSFNTSSSEEHLYEELLKENVNKTILRNYKDVERYPFYCDFYIVEDDLFIELNAHWTHGGRPFDENDEDCLKQLSVWKEKSKTSKFYENAIQTWTVRDVKKQRIAKENNLNYKTIY